MHKKSCALKKHVGQDKSVFVAKYCLFSITTCTMLSLHIVVLIAFVYALG